ncbi:MAG: hypothetical protein P4L85_22005 [Paludisphaera borealis]|uniref:hypothetical protein n=1 Tax=Paludisphaera borealis TaxID=1387353 RepID=UPI00284EFF79|nr:hypothetical protein [Paludisphaera borealis]MDR3622039.1 hypothetical protein [Paludisphaera borealis]
MSTTAQLQANRANAKKSCGPKTDEGKARSRLNALKHGLRATTVNPVLPHEDPAELEAKIREWIDDYQPTNAIERELVVRAARISWNLDRAERHETALLARNVRKAMLRSKAKRTEKVCDYGRKLFYMAGKRLLPISGPAWSDDPSAFVARLEESPEGVQWLLDRWVEMRCLIISNENWTFLDQFKFVRLLGKQPLAAIDDPELNEIFLAWETIEDQWGTRFWLQMQEMTPYEDPAFSAWRVWREIVPRPETPEAAVAFLLSIAEREVERLQELLMDIEEIEGDDPLELAEQASFSASDAFERLRRFQTARTRELLRTIDLLAKLRAASKKATKEANPPAPRKPAARPSSYRSDPIENLVAEGMTDYLAKLLEAGERPSRTPQKRANEATVCEAETCVLQQVKRPIVDSAESERSQSVAEPEPARAPTSNVSDRIQRGEGVVLPPGREQHAAINPK